MSRATYEWTKEQVDCLRVEGTSILYAGLQTQTPVRCRAASVIEDVNYVGGYRVAFAKNDAGPTPWTGVAIGFLDPSTLHTQTVMQSLDEVCADGKFEERHKEIQRLIECIRPSFELTELMRLVEKQTAQRYEKIINQRVAEVVAIEAKKREADFEETRKRLVDERRHAEMRVSRIRGEISKLHAFAEDDYLDEDE